MAIYGSEKAFKKFRPQITITYGEPMILAPKGKKITREDGGMPFANAQVGISMVLRDSGKKADAVKHMTEVLEKAPGGIDPPTTAKLWCELGQALEATGKHVEAAFAFREAEGRTRPNRESRRGF